MKFQFIGLIKVQNRAAVISIDNPAALSVTAPYGMGIALSHEPYKEFQHRIEAEGLESYLTVKMMDYRDLSRLGRQFDRVVSLGMVEHVSRKNYQLFNDCVDKALKEGWVYLLHFISA